MNLGLGLATCPTHTAAFVHFSVPVDSFEYSGPRRAIALIESWCWRVKPQPLAMLADPDLAAEERCTTPAEIGCWEQLAVCAMLRTALIRLRSPSRFG
jgi:hypothetical protein